MEAKGRAGGAPPPRGAPLLLLLLLPPRPARGPDPRHGAEEDAATGTGSSTQFPDPGPGTPES